MTCDGSTVRRLVFVPQAREFGFFVGTCRELPSLCGDQRRSGAVAKHIAAGRLDGTAKKQRDLRSPRDEPVHLVDARRGETGRRDHRGRGQPARRQRSLIPEP